MKSLLGKLGVLFIGLLILGNAKVWGVEQPEGFMGMKWGESTSQCKEKGLCRDDSMGPTMRNGLNLIMAIGVKEHFIGSIMVTVYYFFYNDKLYKVSVKPDYKKDFTLLEEAVKSKYGDPKTENLYNTFGAVIGYRHIWNLGTVYIQLELNKVKDKLFLSYLYLPIANELKRDRGSDKKMNEIKDKL